VPRSVVERIFSIRSARACLLAIVALAPLVTTQRIGGPPLTHDAFELPKAIVVRTLAAAALFIWAVAARREGRAIRVSWWLAPVGVYVGWVGLATAFSAAPVVSLLGSHGRLGGFITALGYGILAFTAMQVFASGKHMVSLARAVTVSALIVSVFGVAQTQGFNPFFDLGTGEVSAGRVYATLGNPVFLGGFLVLVVPMLTAVALADDSRVWRLTAWAGVLAGMVSLIATASRAAWVVALVEIAVLLAIVVRKRVRIPRSALAAVVVGSAVGASVIARSLRSHDPVMNVAMRFSTIFRGDGGSATERMLISRAAIRAVMDRPLFGFGPGRFSVAFSRFRPIEHAKAFPAFEVDNAHDMVLHVAATAGIVAAVAWMAAAIWPVVTSARHAWSPFSESSTHQRLVLSGLWLGAAGYSAFMLTGISVIDAGAIFWITLATLASVTARSWTPKRRLPLVLSWLTGLLVVVTIGFSATRFVADNRYMLAREIVHGMVAGDSMAATERALSYAPYDVTYRRHVVELTQVTDPQRAKTAARDVLSIEPDDKATILMLAQIHLGLGESEEAVRVLQRAEELAPEDPMVDSLLDLAKTASPGSP